MTHLNSTGLRPAVAATPLSHMEPQQKDEQQRDTAQGAQQQEHRSHAFPSLPAESTPTYILFAVTSVIVARDLSPCKTAPWGGTDPIFQGNVHI